MKDAWILTYSKMKFNVFYPRPEDVNIKDIAHGLSHICRFSGQSKFFFSVAQHSLNAMRYARRYGYSPEMQLYCLLHDAAETYISDVPAPIKEHLPEFNTIEKNIMEAVHTAFNLPQPGEIEQKIMDKIDKIMLVTEARILLHGTKGWGEEINSIGVDERTAIREISIKQIRNRFLYEFLNIYESIKQ